MIIDSGWIITRLGEKNAVSAGSAPTSVYKAYIENKLIDDPFYGENEYKMNELSRHDYDFETRFNAFGDCFSSDTERVVLRFNGVDTLSEVFLNGVSLGKTDNMHRIYEFDATGIIRAEENVLLVRFKSPTVFCEERYKERPLWGVDSTVDGFPYLRKAHYMLGWDWGPKSPDIGIWRSVELFAVKCARIDNVYCTQRFNKDYSRLKLTVTAQIKQLSSKPLTAAFILRTADNDIFTVDCAVKKDSATAVFTIEKPALWYPRGYGEQPLNLVSVTLSTDGDTVDEYSETIGFRTLTISNDQKNGEFCFVANGIKLFAMGADYIPEHQILTMLTEESTSKLLSDCCAANYNILRIWGGGIYPSDHFLSECDRLGIILWQDFMFACAAYLLRDGFKETVEAELRDNIIRMRSHSCIGMWCGNNEIESMWEGWGIPRDDEAKADYVTLFEKIIPEALKKYDPERFYWPSSPSSGGGLYGGECFKGSHDNNRGDQHYWAIWHSFYPLEAFRREKFPFCSEYGFEAIPDIKTVRSFAGDGELNLCSPVLENHQKCTKGNEKLLFYIAQMCRYPYSFEKLIYASQLVQSEAIRSDVEHLRRNRGKCMGSCYWQVNDCNPVISWSSIDFYGRWKALHYAAKRFYQPIMLSCLEENTNRVELSLCNETLTDFSGDVLWALCDRSGKALLSGEDKTTVPALSAKAAAILDLSEYLSSREEKRTRYLRYRLTKDGKSISEGTAIFVRPKEFEFILPEISFNVEEDEDSFNITLYAKAFAKAVCLSLKNADCHFDDNWLDIMPKESAVVTVRKSSLSRELSLPEFTAELQTMSCYDLM